MAQRAKNSPLIEPFGLPESILFGRSQTMAAIRRNLQKVADTNIPILIEGRAARVRKKYAGSCTISRRGITGRSSR